MMIDRMVGETFTFPFGAKTLQVQHSKTCRGCYFHVPKRKMTCLVHEFGDVFYRIVGPCTSQDRHDNQSVIFKRVK